MDSQPQRTEKKQKEKNISTKKTKQKSRIIENPEELSPSHLNNAKPLENKIASSDQQNSLNISFDSNSINNISDNNMAATAATIVSKGSKVTINQNNNAKISKNTTNNSKNAKNSLTPQNSKSNPNTLTSKGALNKSVSIQKSQYKQEPLDFSIVDFYKKERGKINIWTYLFCSLNKAISDIYNMCEIEGKEEYAKGVLETLGSSCQDFKKLIHKVKIENLGKANLKSVAWELSNTNTANELPNKQEMETFVEDLEEPDNVDFTLLTQLINEKKMTFDEAIVLLIRERALLLDEPLLTLQYNSHISNNNSFISKYSSEFLDALKEFKDDSNLIENGTNRGSNIESYEHKRSRSTTPSRVSLARLMNKVNWRLINNQNFSIKEEDENFEEKKEYLEEKLNRAQEIRKNLENNKQNFLKKEKEKFIAARKRVEMKRLEKDRINENISRKLDEADQRYEAHIHNIKHRAKNQITKTHEIAFITMLETQTKKIVLDEKLNECRERKLKIISNMKQRLYERNLRETEVEKRRLAQKREIEEQRKNQQTKLEEAESRRLKLLEEKRKHVEELNKEKTVVSERKKSQVTGKEIKTPNLPTKKTKCLDPLKEKIKQKFLKDKERFDHILELLSHSNCENLKTIEEDVSSSFITVDDESEEIPKKPKIQKRKLKMNSLDNSREFNVCFEDDLSIDNSILFYDPKNQEKNGSTQKIDTNENINISKKGKKKTNKKFHAKNLKKKFQNSQKAQRFMTIPSCSMPNLKLMSCIRTNKSKNIYLRISKNGTLCKAKISIIYPKNKKFSSKSINPSEEIANNAINDPNLTENNIKTPEIVKEPIKNQGKASPIKGNNSKTKINPSLSIIKTKVPTLKPLNELTPSHPSEKLEEMKPSQLSSNTIIQNNSQLSESKDNAALNNETGYIRWCQLCNLILSDDVSNSDHLATKAHKKFKSLYGLTPTDDIITFQSGDPGNEELKAERLNAYKKRCKKIKQTLATKALKHETAALIGKESTSPNKQRLQKLCIELEKQILPQIKDYNSLENSLKDSIKLLEQRREADLHIMRQLKFVPLLMEICKKLSTCHRNEINDILKILDFSSNLLSLFCGLVDNRSYMLTTNRLIPLVDLLLWCLNRPTKFVYSLGFVPILFNIITTHLKHRLSPERIAFKEYLIEYIFSSGFLLKIKQKFMSFNGGLDLSTCMGKVPLALLKSLNFLETLTNYLGIEVSSKPVFEHFKISESITFMLKQSDLIGIINLLVSMLLSEGSYGKIPGKVLPQTVLTLTMVSLKFLNNVARLNLDLLQKSTCSKNNEDSVYHIFNYLLRYCQDNYDNSEDTKDLLNELVLLIGYNSLLNEKSQEILSKGEQTIMQKLTSLPFTYICDKKLKEVLFPTLISCIFKNERNLKIILQEISIEIVLGYLNHQIQTYPYEKPAVSTKYTKENISEEKENINDKSQEKQEKTTEKIPSLTIIEEKKDEEPEEGIYSNYMRYVRDSQMKNEKKGPRSLSISSTTSSQNNSCLISSSQHFCFPLRFPRQLWEDVIDFINSVGE